MVPQTSVQTSVTKWILQAVCLLNSLLSLCHFARVSVECSSQDVQGELRSVLSFYFSQPSTAALGISRNVRPNSFDISQPAGGENVRSAAGEPRHVEQPHPRSPPRHHDVLRDKIELQGQS